MNKVSDAVRGAQLLISSEKRITPDGIWGPVTDRAYIGVSDTVRSRVDKFVEWNGLSVSDIRASLKPKFAGAASFVRADVIMRYIKEASAVTAIQPEVLQKFLDLEAIKVSRPDGIYYDAASVAPNGLFHGLFQMGAPAWSDVRRSGIDVGLFEANRYDPRINTLAAAQYAKLNMMTARKLGYDGDFTPEVLYGMHNQGATGFVRLLQSGKVTSALRVQSQKAKEVIAITADRKSVV